MLMSTYVVINVLFFFFFVPRRPVVLHNYAGCRIPNQLNLSNLILADTQLSLNRINMTHTLVYDVRVFYAGVSAAPGSSSISHSCSTHEHNSLTLFASAT